MSQSKELKKKTTKQQQQKETINLGKTVESIKQYEICNFKELAINSSLPWH